MKNTAKKRHKNKEIQASPAKSSPAGKNDLRIALLVSFFAFVIYLLTLAPTVFFGDSGEFVTGAYHLGIVHPPGYPLYLLLGKLFMTLVPFGDMAFRLNLMSAFFASLTVGLIYIAARQLKLSIPAALLSAVMATGSFQFWTQALIAEVYTLAAFFFMLIFCLTLSWYRNRDRKTLLVLAFTAGLALTHHITIASFYIVIAVFVLIYEFKIIKDFRFIIKAVILFLLPLLLYLYLPIRSSANPPTDWGNPDNLKRMVGHVTAKQYKGKLLEHGVEGVKIQFTKFLGASLKQYTPVLLPVILLGFVLAYRREKGLFLLILALTLVNIAYSHIYYIVDIESYFIPAFLLWALVAAYSWDFLYKLVKEKGIPLERAGIAVLLLISMIPIIFNWSDADRSGNYLARNYGMNMYATIDDGGIFFSHGDNESFIMAYLSLVEGVRPDVTVYDRTQNILPYPMVKNNKTDKPVPIVAARQWEREMVESSKKPVYFNFEVDPTYPLVQTGILYKVFRTGDKVPDSDEIWSRYDLDGLEDPSLRDDFMTRFVIAKYREMRAKDFLAHEKEDEALEMIEKAREVGWDEQISLVGIGYFYLDMKKYDEAERILSRAVSLNPFSGDSYNGLGTVEFNRENYEKAIEYYDKTLELKPDNQSALRNRALSYERLGEPGDNDNYRERMFKLAVNDLKKIREINPYDKRIERDIIRLTEKFKTSGDVIDTYRKSLAREPENLQLRYSYAVFLANNAMFDAAIAQFKIIVQKDDTFLSAVIDLGGAYLKTRQEAKAWKMFKRALELDPQNKKAKQGILMIRRAVESGKLKLELDQE